MPDDKGPGSGMGSALVLQSALHIQGWLAKFPRLLQEYRHMYTK